MPTTIDRLRMACRRCLDDGDDQLVWLGRSLNEFLTQRCRSLDEALGLQVGRGGIPWWREEANRKRDAALRELAARHLLEHSVTAQARQVHVLSVRYAASAWRFDRDRPSMPPHYAGTPHEWLWLAFSSGAPMPIGERQLRNILPGCRPAARSGAASAATGLPAEFAV
jgi:hypothetical protein